LGPFQAAKKSGLKADSGELKEYGVVGQPQVIGAGDDAGRVDAPSAYITLSAKGEPLGTYLVTCLLEQPQTVRVGDKSYQLQLRFKRYYKDYTLYLKKFSFDRYLGTNVPKNYSSLVRLID